MTKTLVLVLLGVSGCIMIPPPKIGTASGAVAPTQAQVSNCEALRTAHNNWTLVGVIAGGLAGASGPVDAVVTAKVAQEGVGVGIAVSGVLAAVATTVAGFKADDYTQANCADILSQAATP